jgi:hypothetical protein
MLERQAMHILGSDLKETFEHDRIVLPYLRLCSNLLYKQLE